MNPALGVMAGLAALPLLHACARHCESSIPGHWPHGYCPVCGAWAATAELLGVERARVLRCGRCTAAWRTTWLLCPYCGERNHTALGRLVPEGSEAGWAVETCNSCRGYLKCFTRLKPSAPLELLLEDVRTVELDLAALDREFHRPAQPGRAMTITLRSDA